MKAGAKYVSDQHSLSIIEPWFGRYIKVFHETGNALGYNLKKPSPELLAAIATAAHKHGMICIAHVTSLPDTIECLEAGVDGLVHAFIDQPVTQEVIDLFVRTKAFVNPTLVVMESCVEEATDEHVDVMNKSGQLHLLDEKTKEEQAMCYCMKGPNSTAKYAYDAMRKFNENGIDIVW